MPTLAHQHLGHLPGHVLFALARNESASREWRKAAVELLLDGNHREAGNPDIRELVLQINAERQAKSEVQAVVEAAVEAEVFEPEEKSAQTTVDPHRNSGSAPARVFQASVRTDNRDSEIRPAAPDS